MNIKRLNLAELLIEIDNKNVKPISLSNSSKIGIASYLQGNEYFLDGFNYHLNDWWYESDRTSIYKYVTIDDFAMFISEKTGEEPKFALWRFAAAIFWKSLNINNKKVEEIQNALTMGIPIDLNEYDLKNILLLDTRNYYDWGELLDGNIKNKKWQNIIELTNLCYISYNEFAAEKIENILYRYYGIFLRNIANMPIESIENAYYSSLSKKEKMDTYVDYFLESSTFKADYNFEQSFIFRLIFNCRSKFGSEFQVLNSGIRTTIDCYSKADLNTMDYIFSYLKYHMDSKNSKKIFYSRNFNLFEATNEEKKLMDFIKFIEIIASDRWDKNIDTYCLRASEVAKDAGELLDVFTYWIIKAFATEISAELVAIFCTCISDDAIRMIEYHSERQNDKFSSTGCVIDKIFRNIGIKENTPSPIELRDLFLPFAPISGITWLNDFNIEHLLFNASLKAENNFAQEYNNSFNEREDDLIRDLFDDNMKSAFETAIKEINLYHKSKNSYWTLSWTKLRLIEEKVKGPDIALKIKVCVSQKVEFEKYIFIQVKAISKQNNKFASSWTINRKQLQDLINFSDSSFYLLLTPSNLSNHQRVIPASIVRGMLQANNRQVSLADNIAAFGAHSLSHFLIYDVLAGWQGTQNQANINWLEKRKGMKVRYLLEIELKSGIEND